MKKQRAIRNYIILSILLLVCFVFSFVSFKIPTTVNNFAGFINGIYRGTDFNNGVTATYTVSHTDNYENDESATLAAKARVEKLISAKYAEFSVEMLDDNKIKIVIPRLEEDTTISSYDLVNYITFTTTEVTDSNRETFEAKFTGKHISGSRYFSNNGQFGALVEFTEEGKEVLLEMANGLSETSTSTLYIYQNADWTSVLIRISIDKSSLTTIANSKQLFVSDVSILPTKDDAVNFANKIASGMLNIDMETENGESICSANFGGSASLIAGLIVLAVILITAALLWARYGQLSLAMIMSQLCFVAMSIILLPLFSAIQMSYVGVIGIIFAYAITLIGNIAYVERARDEFAAGKKLLAGFKSAYVKSVISNVDMYVITFVTSVIVALLGMGAIKTIASVISLLLIPSAITTLLINRGMVKWYLDINPTKYKKIKFEKGAEADEEN